jgi:hypothetical protein
MLFFFSASLAVLENFVAWWDMVENGHGSTSCSVSFLRSLIWSVVVTLKASLVEDLLFSRERMQSSPNENRELRMIELALLSLVKS